MLIRGQVWETSLELYLPNHYAEGLGPECPGFDLKEISFSGPIYSFLSHSRDCNICELAVGCPQLLVQ